MTMIDISYHYPADLLSLLIDTIPLICRSKKDIILFFTGAGVGASLTADLAQQLASDPKAVNKFQMVRVVLGRINDKGEIGLGERRQVLKRVTEFEDFSSCWPDDRLKAQGLVGQVQKLVNVKDSFTRMSHERDEERRKRQEQLDREAKARQDRDVDLEAIKTDFFRLFAEKDALKRGKALEGVLNRYFKAQGVLVRDAFILRGDPGQGVVEQIDGVIEIEGNLYLVEMKWWSEALGKGDVSNHMVGVYNRSQARGILIANPGFTEAAIATCKEGLHQSVFVLCELQEFVRLMTDRLDLKSMLKAKISAAVVEKTPLFRAWTGA